MKAINFDRRLRRKIRVSANIIGTKETPRVSVFRSNRYVYAQAIDDVNKVTLAAATSLKLSKRADYKKTKKVDEAKEVGINLARELKGKNIKEAVFDRSLYAYAGRVKAVSEGLRKGGIKI